VVGSLVTEYGTDLRDSQLVQAHTRVMFPKGRLSGSRHSESGLEFGRLLEIAHQADSIGSVAKCELDSFNFHRLTLSLICPHTTILQ